MNVHSNGGGSGGRRGGSDDFPVRRLPVSRAGAPRPYEIVEAQTDEVLRSAVDRARQLADEQPEPFRSLAFTTLLAHLLDGGAPSPAGRVAAPVPASPPPTDMQIAEFLAQRRIESHPDRVVAIAYYHYQRFDGQGITTKDLVEAYTRSRAKRPQNFPDVIASCVRKGYLVDGGRREGMKTWIITGTGEAHVEQDM
jgi:hypothetical protein